MFAEVVVVTPEGARLALRDYGGPADAPGIVLVHGLASNVAIWDLVGPELAGRFRVIAYDQRSHGRSDDATDYSFLALAEDCAAVAATLSDPVVVGHSWGASVALHYAAGAASCPGVVCVDGGVMDLKGSGMDWETTERRLRPPHIEGPPDEVLGRIRSVSTLPWDAAVRVARRSFVVGEDGVMRRRTPITEHMKIVRQMWDEGLWDLYDVIVCPVLLVLARAEGAGSGFTAAKGAAATELATRKADLRVEWIDSVHDVPLAKPAELAESITRFVTALQS
jgi:pimeloyl-ACP methyl ester carboxylesterase